jgi:hypothetical protein
MIGRRTILVIKERWDEAYGKLRELHPNDDYNFDVFRNEMLDALGEDEAEALDFLQGLIQEDKAYLTSIDEEIMAKFPSDEMSQFIQDEVITPARFRQATR